MPEVFQGLVKIIDVAREPGVRSKVSVSSVDENIDPIGACIGSNGTRIKKMP